MLIMVADEDKEYAEIVAELLRFRSYEVITEESASDVLRTAEIRQPDLVIMSVSLSSGLGVEVAAQLTDRQPRLPVIMTASRRRDADVIASFEAGAADFVTKPFHPREFIARVDSIVRRYREQMEQDHLIQRHAA